MCQMIIREDELSKSEIADLIGNQDHIVILDIGCYDGEDADKLSQQFESCKIHCFEPDPRSIDLFRKHSSHNPKLKLHEVAVGSEVGQVDLWLSDSENRKHYEDQTSWSASSSLAKPTGHLKLFPDVKFNETLVVESTTLDQWYKWHLPGYIIDFIWADVNGGELNLVLGAKDTLTITKYLYIEFAAHPLYEGQSTKEELLAALPDFELLGIYNYKGNFGNLLLKNKTLL